MIFRGKTKAGKRVEGYYLKNIDGENIIWFQTLKLIEVGLKEEIETYFHKILPESLAMSTELKDKNGKMIFGSIPVDGKMSVGGDIVRFSSNYPDSPVLSRKRTGEVFFKTDGSIDFCFRVKKEGNFGLNSNDISCYEVIGNAIDNPELI